MGNAVTRAKENMRNRMTMRRRRPPEDEFSQEDIKRRFLNIPILTTTEMEVIRSSWELIKTHTEAVSGKKEVGLHTFLEMFEAFPDTRDVFKKFRGQDMTGLEQSLELRQHGKRLMKLLDQVVQTIDNYDRLWDILIKLGKNHFNYGALPMYLNLMGPHFVIAIRAALEDDWYEALEYHWLQLFNILVYIMEFGWNLQRAEEQKRARMTMDAPPVPATRTKQKKSLNDAVQ